MKERGRPYRLLTVAGIAAALFVATPASVSGGSIAANAGKSRLDKNKILSIIGEASHAKGGVAKSAPRAATAPGPNPASKPRKAKRAEVEMGTLPPLQPTETLMSRDAHYAKLFGDTPAYEKRRVVAPLVFRKGNTSDSLGYRLHASSGYDTNTVTKANSRGEAVDISASGEAQSGVPLYYGD